ncbi:hypothetical protein ACQCVH_22190 [Bacillus infantis]|uniref:hypothetical protein n=1 Tax=Bacillus infantis TaxID=324767 RepID=UPI003CF18B52
MLEKHDEVINTNVLPRLDALELENAQFKQEMSALKADLIGVQKGQAQLELTVMKDGRETRELLKPFADHVLKQVEFDAQSEKDLKMKKMDTREKILTGVFGAGSLAGIIAAIVTLIQ